MSQSGPQGPPALHQWGNTGSNTGEERHFLGVSGRGADFTLQSNSSLYCMDIHGYIHGFGLHAFNSACSYLYISRCCLRGWSTSIINKYAVTWFTTWPRSCRYRKCTLFCVSKDTDKNLRLCVSDSIFCIFVFFFKGLSSTTSITVDFGDGTAISYVNISSIDDGVKHIYSKVGIYQVSATATNTLGFDRVILYLHVSCESQNFILTLFLHANNFWLCLVYLQNTP